MEYVVGKKFKWIPTSRHEVEEVVTVDKLLNRGTARLSNGWTVDEDGIAEGTNRRLGGRIVEHDSFAKLG